MLPVYRSGEKVLVSRWFIILHVKDVIVCLDPRDKKPLLKRIQKIENKKFFVVGDNKSESTDSRQFGWIERKDIIGEVIMKIQY